jgi:hypothetical protein
MADPLIAVVITLAIFHFAFCYLSTRASAITIEKTGRMTRKRRDSSWRDCWLDPESRTFAVKRPPSQAGHLKRLLLSPTKSNFEFRPPAPNGGHHVGVFEQRAVRAIPDDAFWYLMRYVRVLGCGVPMAAAG